MPRKRPGASETKVAPAMELPQTTVKVSEAAEQKQASNAGKPNEKKAKKEGKTEKAKAAAPTNAKGVSTIYYALSCKRHGK